MREMLMTGGVLFWGAHAFYRTESFAEEAEFVAAISEVAEEIRHFPDIDLRPEDVTIRTFTSVTTLTNADRYQPTP